MGRITSCLILASLLAIPIAAAGSAGDIGNNPDAIGGPFLEGQPTLQLRPRYNRISESGKPELTHGGTLRVIAGWRTAPFHAWRLTVEAIVTEHFGRQRFNDDPALINTSPYPLLPDPRHAGVNRLHVDGEVEGIRVRLGRQVAHVDDQRWVSDNDFRQIPQLFDGISAAITPLADTELMAAHYARVRGTSGSTQALRLTLLHAAWNPVAGHAIAAYGVFHEQAQNGAFTGFADNSYRVAGLRASGALLLSPALRLAYLADAARQRRFAGGDARIDARYWRMGAGLEGGPWLIRYDRETKGSNHGLFGLQNPLTDFYAFNGWTLHFFNTPREGLRDGWLTARYESGPVSLYLEAHRFRSDFGSLDFGRESDLGVTWRVRPEAMLRLQHARYDPGGGGTGAVVRKTWLTLTYSY
jgi:hypothetical protein